MLSASLATALRDLNKEESTRDLAAGVNRLSRRYRDPERTGAIVRSDSDARAYAAYRLPATYAALSAVFDEIAPRQREFQPVTMLDVGAGPGTATWAGSETWSSLQVSTLLEANASMRTLGQRLVSLVGAPVPHMQWVAADALEGLTNNGHDLVVASYFLNEINPEALTNWLDSLWDLTGGTLVLLEAGTPNGFGIIRAARRWLLDTGAHMVGPCPHAVECPMSGDDWCHFSQRLPRSSAHRDAKHARLSYEDEKYSYVAVSRMPASIASARVVRHPQVRPGRIALELCTSAGLRSRLVTRSAREEFRAARHARWGSDFRAADTVRQQ